MENALLSGLETMPQEQQQQNAALSGQITNQTNALKLQQAQKFSSLLSQMAAPQGKDGTPPTASNQMMQLGLTAMRAGLPQGMTMVNNALTAQTKLSEAASRQVTAEAAQTRAHVGVLKQQIAQYEQHMAPAAGALSQVTDPASWDQFANFMHQQYGDSEYLGTPYNPQTVDALRYQMMGTKNALAQAKQKADAVHQQSVLKEREQYHRVMERVNEARAESARVSAEASRIRAEASANRNTRLAKVGGGKAVSPPPNSMVLQSKDMIKREFPEMDQVDSNDFSYSVAASARAMMQKNPGLNAQAAIMQALTEQKDQYVLEKPKWPVGDTPVFNPQGTGIAASFKTPQEVVAAYKGGKIPKAEAENFLSAMGASGFSTNVKGPANGKSVEDWMSSGAATAGSPSSVKDIAASFIGKVGANFRDLGDMALGSPAAAVKAAVESAVSAYKSDPRAGVQAGQALANNPAFAPWLHPLLSAQQAVTGKEVPESGLNQASGAVFNAATKIAQDAGKKVGVPKATTQIIVDDLMATLGLKGLHAGGELAAKAAAAMADPAKAAAAVAGTEPVSADQPTAETPLSPDHIQALRAKYPDLFSATQRIADTDPVAVHSGKTPQPVPDKYPVLFANARRLADTDPVGAYTGKDAQTLPERHPELFSSAQKIADTDPMGAYSQALHERAQDILEGKAPPSLLAKHPALFAAAQKMAATDPAAAHLLARLPAAAPATATVDAGLKIGPVGRSPFAKRQSGFVTPDAMKKLGIAAGGAIAFNYLDPQDKWKSYATGAALGLVGAWAAPHIREGLKADTRLRIDKYINDFEAAKDVSELKTHHQVQGVRQALPNVEDRIAVTHALDVGDARGLTDAQSKVYSGVKEFFRTIGEQAQKAKVLKELRDAYVTHIWDHGANKGRGGSFLTTTSPFANPRSVLTLVEGKAMGLTPRTEDIAEIMDIYGRSMSNAIAGKTLMDTLKGLKDPRDSLPLIALAGNAPRGYVPVDLPQLRGFLVHPDIAPSLRMLENGRLDGFMEHVSDTVQGVKRIKMMGSLFHPKTLVEVGIASRPFGELKNLPGRLTAFTLGKDSLLHDLNHGGMSETVQSAMKHGLKVSLDRETPDVEDAGGGFYQGMQDMQRWTDENFKPAGKAVHGLTEANHKLDTFTWARLHAGLKLMVFDETRHRLMQNGVDRERAGAISANYTNTQFGGLNWRRMAEGARTRWGRDAALAMLNPKARTVTQLMMFAPDWTVSTIRQLTQAIYRKGGPMAQVKGFLKPTELADLHRQAVVRSALYYAIAGSGVNMLFTGKPIWENKNPLRVDLGTGQTMSFSKHLTEPLEWFKHPIKTAGGKLSVLATEPINQLTGQEYIGGPKMQENRLVHAAKQVLPFSATAADPVAALSGMAGFPIYGHTYDQQDEIAAKRRYRREEKEDGGR